ncbi:HpcH/HpaI aldolase/citrate lyase family protein [Neobacillus niacini]|uniref:HpcH/HpaI aldolase family protein n=1 Tax=Neobacillus niacini TaxID=86668 RepID=UPI0021CB45A8|nr:aldolase/citrate lyase family protein [Neobacillus niacini]MCM3766312.1 aldolase/citrate lyase family protein [Neobacillus niacini]
MKMDLKQRLELKPCIGTFLKIPRPEIVDVLALAGFDFIICDMEHAQISEEEARSVIRAGVNAGIPVVVRLPEPVQGLVNRLLEAGAVGIQMPRLRKASETKELYSMMHFPPLGTRSVGVANIFANYGSVTIKDYLDSENARVLTVGQFETKAIDDCIENMFDGLDVAFIGPTDLAVDFGVPGNIHDPNVQRHLAEIEKAANKTGTIMGAFAGNLEQAKYYIERGYRFLAVSGDISLVAAGANSLVKAFRENFDGLSIGK